MSWVHLLDWKWRRVQHQEHIWFHPDGFTTLLQTSEFLFLRKTAQHVLVRESKRKLRRKYLWKSFLQKRQQVKSKENSKKSSQWRELSKWIDGTLSLKSNFIIKKWEWNSKTSRKTKKFIKKVFIVDEQKFWFIGLKLKYCWFDQKLRNKKTKFNAINHQYNVRHQEIVNRKCKYSRIWLSKKRIGKRC